MLQSDKVKLWLAICEEGVTLTDEELEREGEGEGEIEEGLDGGDCKHLPNFNFSVSSCLRHLEKLPSFFCIYFHRQKYREDNYTDNKHI